MSEKIWCVLNTKPHCEQLVYDALSVREIKAYLPLWKPLPGARDRAKARPFFPCYLFANTDAATTLCSSLEYLPGVRHLLKVGDQPACISPAEIEQIRSRIQELENQITDAQGQPLVPGDRVRILSGPFQGMDAIFDQRLSSSERVRILINFLRQRTPLAVDHTLIEKTLPVNPLSLTKRL